MDFIGIARPIREHRWAGYAFAFALVGATVWARAAIGAPLDGYPFLLAFVAVTLAVFFGGAGPGIVTAIVLGLLVKYFNVAPLHSFALVWPGGWVAFSFYTLLNALIISTIHGVFTAHAALSRSEAAVRALNADLETRVASRTAALEDEMARRSQAEAQLRQIQKMESIGQLTGGIAHDFNNMLAIVIGSLDLARRKMTGTEHRDVGRCIDNASEGAKRAATLTARLLAFSRQQPLAPQVLDANRLVAGMSELLRRTIGEHIRVETVLAGGLWHAFADPGQLESAILNLAVNARDAMPDGGKLTIETGNAELDDRYARANEEVAPGQYVLICITDSGTGMPAEVIARAFDPFFTTKEVGKGTGLGLSQVYGYVKQSGGHVKIYSEPSQGTSIKMYLPRHRGGIAATAEHGNGAAHPPGDPDRIILVVEDDAQVRQMTVDALRELGYTVVQAGNADEALEQFTVQPRVDLLLTDIVMPDMNGRELADRVRQARPGLRVLFTTGYTRNAVVHNGILDAGVAFLPKPFTIAELAAKVGDALAAPGSEG